MTGDRAPVYHAEKTTLTLKGEQVWAIAETEYPEKIGSFHINGETVDERP